MNETETEITPANLLILSVEMVDDSPTDGLCPANNFVGSLLLAALLDSVLESAGERLYPTIPEGPLNHGLFVCVVKDANRAARLICEQVLSKAALKSVTRIFRRDVSEDLLRCVYPQGGDVASEIELISKIFAVCGQTYDALAKSAGRIQALQKLSPPAKPGDPPIS